MRYSILTTGLVAMALTTACENSPTGGTKQTVGTVLGAVGGGVLGSQIGSGSGKTAATIGGTLLGGLIGGYIGKSMDDTDKLMAERNAQNTLERSRTGTTSSWRNPDSGHAGDFTVNRTFTGSGGQNCREYTQTVQIGSQREKAYGTACRQSDGSWQIAPR